MTCSITPHSEIESNSRSEKFFLDPSGKLNPTYTKANEVEKLEAFGFGTTFRL